jgi:hypothetical protein
MVLSTFVPFLGAVCIFTDDKILGFRRLATAILFLYIYEEIFEKIKACICAKLFC